MLPLLLALTLAEPPEPVWDAVEVKIIQGVSGEGEILERYPGMFVANAPEAGPMLTCFEGRYRISIGLKQPNFREIAPEITRRARYVSAALIIDGEKTLEDQWVYVPETKVISIGKRKPAAQVYNAAIREQQVEVKVGRKTYDLAVPPLNDEFRLFANNCIAERDDPA